MLVLSPQLLSLIVLRSARRDALTGRDQWQMAPKVAKVFASLTDDEVASIAGRITNSNFITLSNGSDRAWWLKRLEEGRSKLAFSPDRPAVAAFELVLQQALSGASTGDVSPRQLSVLVLTAAAMVARTSNTRAGIQFGVSADVARVLAALKDGDIVRICTSHIEDLSRPDDGDRIVELCKRNDPRYWGNVQERVRSGSWSALDMMLAGASVTASDQRHAA